MQWSLNMKGQSGLYLLSEVFETLGNLVSKKEKQIL